MTTDPASRLARLRRKLAEASDPEDQADLAAAIAALEKELAGTYAQTIGEEAQVGIAVAGSVHGNIYLDGRRADQAARLLAAYLVQLRGRCGTLPLEGVRQQKQLDDVLKVSLDKVYTQLTTTNLIDRDSIAGDALQHFDLDRYQREHTGIELLPQQLRVVMKPIFPNEGDDDDQLVNRTYGRSSKARILTNGPQQLPLSSEELKRYRAAAVALVFGGPELVTDAIADNQRLVLLGEPGSGKSTALRYLALTLAQAGLDAQLALPERLAGWERLPEQGRLLPVFVPLLPFARLLAADASKAGTAAALWEFLADQLEPGVRTGLAEAVHAELAAGRVLLLLDGLDEVAGDDSRRKVVRAVSQFADEHPTCRIVVSCRVRAYVGEQNRAWQLPGWPTATLADWNNAQIQYFIAAWYQAAVAAGGLAEAQLSDRVAALQRAIAASPDLQRLAARPLLLTIMALVHLNDGRLPEDRVTLYSRCIDILLGQWELRGKDFTAYGSLMDAIGLPDRDVQRLRPLLTRAAFEAHRASTPDSPGSLSRETLRSMVMDELEQLGHGDPYRGAQKFLDYTDHRAGLLQASDAGDAYVFPHLTFQEYLAGQELTSGVGVVARIMQHRDDDRWRVPIMLGVGDYVSSNKLELPYQLLSELRVREQEAPQRHQRDLIFAAEIAEDVGWDRLEQGGASFRHLRRDLAQALATVVEGVALPAAERVHAGVLLGELGDPRPGVCALPPVMIPIPGGTFLIGEPKDQAQDDDEANDQPLTLPSFELARYPVTNAQYALFITDGGYNPKRDWWDAAARGWLRAEKRDAPSLWNRLRFGQARPNHPVVGVTWYEATAFCRWLTQHLNDGGIYRLPSEAEWEYAARGTERHIYPWGDAEPDAERANYNRVCNGTTAVGCFTPGKTKTGLHDLAGNAWEWTASVYAPYVEGHAHMWQPPADPAKKRFTLRGGGWRAQPIYVRASDRNNLSPDFHSYDAGFRLARHLPADVKN